MRSVSLLAVLVLLVLALSLGRVSAYPPAGPIQVVEFTQEGLDCKKITFEGAGDMNSVTVVDGATFSSAVSVTHASSTFANEPSPSTVLSLLDGTTSITVTLDQPADVVDFFFTGGYQNGGSHNVNYYDAAGNLLEFQPWASVAIDTFDEWLEVLEGMGGRNVIKTVEILGQWNYLLIDDFTFCSVPSGPVGGLVIPANTLALVAPWLVVIGLVGCIGAVVVVAKKRSP
jgi:hypothetical protein